MSPTTSPIQPIQQSVILQSFIYCEYCSVLFGNPFPLKFFFLSFGFRVSLFSMFAFLSSFLHIHPSRWAKLHWPFWPFFFRYFEVGMTINDCPEPLLGKGRCRVGCTGTIEEHDTRPQAPGRALVSSRATGNPTRRT